MAVIEKRNAVFEAREALSEALRERDEALIAAVDAGDHQSDVAYAARMSVQNLAKRVQALSPVGSTK